MIGFTTSIWFKREHCQNLLVLMFTLLLLSSLLEKEKRRRREKHKKVLEMKEGRTDSEGFETRNIAIDRLKITEKSNENLEIE